MLQDIIQELKQKNISIRFAKGKLTYTGPEEFITPELLAKLKNNKSKLLKHFWPKECWNMMPINTEGNLSPVALIHAGPSNYPISDYLGMDRPYYGYFYIGSEGERIRYKNLEAFAAEYLKQLQFAVPSGPYYLGGLSFGGHLAYEMAIRLQQQGEEVPIIFLIDAGLPDDKRYLPKQSALQQLYEFGKKFYYSLYDLYWRIIFGYLTSFKEKIPTVKRNRYIRWTYKDYIMKYKPSEKYKGKIVLFRAEENKLKSELLGWDRFCDDIILINFKGDHGAMYNDEESVNTIKFHIKKYIDEYENSQDVMQEEDSVGSKSVAM